MPNSSLETPLMVQKFQKCGSKVKVMVSGSNI